jgi:Reverse transcriptase (RNA-dependent DNA polymerase)
VHLQNNYVTRPGRRAQSDPDTAGYRSEERRIEPDQDRRRGIEVRCLKRAYDPTIVIWLPFEALNCVLCADKGRRTCTYHSVKDLQEHMSVAHSELPIRFQCVGCERIFESAHAHSCHQSHCRGRPPVLAHACENCSRSFSSRRSLGQHNRTHYPTGDIKVSGRKGELRSSWTASEELDLLDLEYRNQGRRDLNHLIAAGLRSKGEAQVRARRALMSHRQKAQKYAADKEGARAAEPGVVEGGPRADHPPRQTPNRPGASLKLAQKPQQSLRSSARLRGHLPSEKVDVASFPAGTQRKHTATLGSRRVRVLNVSGLRGLYGRWPAVGRRGRTSSGVWRVSASKPRAPPPTPDTDDTAQGASTEEIADLTRELDRLHSDVPHRQLAPGGPPVREEESRQLPEPRSPDNNHRTNDSEEANFPSAAQLRPKPIVAKRTSARLASREGGVHKGPNKNCRRTPRVLEDDDPTGSESDTTHHAAVPTHLNEIQEAQGTLDPGMEPAAHATQAGNSSESDSSSEDVPPREWTELFSVEFRGFIVPPDLDANEVRGIFPHQVDTWNQGMVDGSYTALVEWLMGRGVLRGQGNTGRKHRTRSYKARKRNKRYAYARTQEMMTQNSGLLAKHVCQGTDHLAPTAVTAPREEVEDLYRKLWGTKVSEGELPTPETPVGDFRPEGFMRPFSVSEVLQRVRQLKRHTAAGPDGIRKDYINVPAHVSLITFLYNRVLQSRNLPSAWSENRTTLIPKEGKDASKATNCRPITIGSLLGRVFWGLISDRFSKVIKISPRQKGFVKEAGCFNNVHALSDILRKMSRTRGGVAVQLDVTKAFDTAPHSAIKTALRNKGIPGFVCDLVARSYVGVTTSIAHPDGNIAIQLLRGVKQGDPLSPLLFNLILEPLLLDLEKMAGFSVGTIRVSVLAFADDLFLLADDPGKAQALLHATETYLNKLGMSLAPEKSLAIYLRAANRSWWLEDPELRVGGVLIEAATSETRFRYLGGFLCPNGKVDIDKTERDIESVLRRVVNLRLSATNKLILLSKHLIPHFLHQLTLALPEQACLNRLDRKIRVVLRKILHLPHWTTRWLLYVACRNGGLGFPNLSNLVTMVGLRLGRKFKIADDPLLKSIWPKSKLKKAIVRYQRSAGLARDYTPADLNKLRMAREEAMLTKWAGLVSQGGAVDAFRESQLGNLILLRPTLLRPCRFITALQMRANVAVTRSTLQRVGSRTTCRCRKCGGRETLGHIIGYCPFTKPARIRRHDDIKEFIAGRLRTQGGQVTSVSVERRFRHMTAVGSIMLQPDITVHRGDAAYLVDVTVRVERPGYVTTATNQKTAKYECLLPGLMAEMETGTAKVLSIVVGARGAMSIETVNNLRTLGVTSRGDMQTISLLALRSTLEMYHAFQD